MIIVFKHDATEEHVTAVKAKILSMGNEAVPIHGAERTIIGVVGSVQQTDKAIYVNMPGVAEVIRISKPYKRASREFSPVKTIVDVNGIKFGGEEIVLIAGPCSVENEDQLLTIARAVKKAGAHVLRGGAFKPRTGPYAFQGLGEEGLELLKLAKKETGLQIATELMHLRYLDLVAEYTDIIQIGARNMQNFDMLQEVGKLNIPVMLKRGLSATMEEFLLAAEYILNGGNKDVILCERGIRTFEKATRNTFDLGTMALIKEVSHLPIIADPSHGTGKRALIKPLSLAAIAAGADGLMIEVHHDPDKALSDGDQAVTPDMFEDIVKYCSQVAKAIDRSLTPPLALF